MFIKLLFFFFFIQMSLFAKDQKNFYSEAADVFEVMDQVSLWHPSIDKTLRNEWILKFGKLFNDQSFFNDYIDLRKKYYKYPLVKNKGEELFTSFEIANNYFSNCFYSTKSLGQALKKLRKQLKKSEIDFLVKFYKHFQNNISIFAKESTFFYSQTKGYIKKIKKLKAKSILKKSKKFILGRRKIKNSKILFTWWPKGKDAKIEVRGKNILVRIHPQSTQNYPKAKTLVLYKIKTYFANLSKNTKRNLNDIFFKSCHPKGVKGSEVFELPLSLALGEMNIESKKDRKEFVFTKDWSIHPWINTYAKLLFTEVNLALSRKDSLSGDFIKNAAKLCKELTLVSDFQSSFNN